VKFHVGDFTRETDRVTLDLVEHQEGSLRMEKAKEEKEEKEENVKTGQQGDQGALEKAREIGPSLDQGQSEPTSEATQRQPNVMTYDHQ